MQTLLNEIRERLVDLVLDDDLSAEQRSAISGELARIYVRVQQLMLEEINNKP